MLPYFTEHYGNPSAIYSFAGESKKAVDEARANVADLINARTEDIYFTGGGSESDNWALKATAEAYESKGKHIITSRIEHHAILHTCAYLEQKGYEVTYLDVDEDGKISLEELEKAIRPDTILISIMSANNETEQSSQSKRSVRSHMTTAYYSTQMRYRHLDIFRSTWKR